MFTFLNSGANDLVEQRLLVRTNQTPHFCSFQQLSMVLLHRPSQFFCLSAIISLEQDAGCMWLVVEFCAQYRHDLEAHFNCAVKTFGIKLMCQAQGNLVLIRIMCSVVRAPFSVFQIKSQASKSSLCEIYFRVFLVRVPSNS